MQKKLTEQLEFSHMTDQEVERVLKKNKIGLSVKEARKIEKILGRAPTLTEAVIWGIQGSEHSSYRSSRQYLSLLPTQAPNVILGPKEDSGIVEIAREGKKKFGAVISHESHNHPSQIVPYEGATTGVGGIVRDIVCMGAKVVGSLDPLRFGNPKKNQTKTIAGGVTDGIAGYGNPLGVPNLGGDIYFNDSFDDNCLVNVVAVGVLAEDEIIHSYAPKNALGYDIIFVGKPTDQSGMGGASFASIELDEADKEANKGAVQEPNPFLERHILAATYELFALLKKKKLINRVGFKDMGAGGNMCASVELVESGGYGAEIDLDKIHIAVDNLHPSIIACAETQERFCWVVPPTLSKLVLKHYNETWNLPRIAANARASLAGKVTKGNYVLKYQGRIVCDAKPEDITKGLRYKRKSKAKKFKLKEPKLQAPKNYNQVLLKLLASENICSRVNIFEQYDKNVQGITVIEPGQADAGVIAPLTDRSDVSEKTRKVGVALSVDGSGSYGAISPFYQGANAVVESMRNVAAVGATPQALTDCLNYGNPEKPEQMWEFIQGVKGISEAAKNVHLKKYPKYPTPFISGNVSFYNQSKNQPVNPSAIVACLGTISDHRQAITMQFKGTDSELYLLGERRNELGGSEYYRLFSKLGKNIPKPDYPEVEKEIFFLTDAIEKGLILSAHDISEGGLAVTVAEMAMGGSGNGSIGAKIELAPIPKKSLKAWQKLFSQTGGFVIEVNSKNKPKVKELTKKHKLKLHKLGKTVNSNQLIVTNRKKELVSLKLDKMSGVWLNSLREKLS